VVVADVEHRGGVRRQAVSVVSSWKLDSSSTQMSGSLPASRQVIRAESAAGLMLPATAVTLPAARQSAPVSAVWWSCRWCR
jgi:hypothetical protein